MGGLKLPRFAAAAAATLLVACAAALVPALVLPGAAGPALSVVLLALLGCSLTVPNVLVHVARRLTVHHCGASRVVHYNVTTGEADLRRRICAAFAGCAAIEPAAIEGLEHPRGSGVVYPLSLVAAAIDSLLGSDCELALLRPEPGATRFRWEDLQPESDDQPEAEQQREQQREDFAQCLAARGYCLVRMPTHTLSGPATVFSQAEEFFRQPASSKASHRYGTERHDLKHGWFAELNREYFEVHRSIVAGGSSPTEGRRLPYPSDAFRVAAEETFDILEGVAHRAMELLLPAAAAAASCGGGGAAADGTVHDEQAGRDPAMWVDPVEAEDGGGSGACVAAASDDSMSERQCLLRGGSHATPADQQTAPMSHAAVRRTLLDGTPTIESLPLDSASAVEAGAAGGPEVGGQARGRLRAGLGASSSSSSSRGPPPQLSTSMFRIHQYNSSEAGLRGGRGHAVRLLGGLRRVAQGLLRRLPFHGIAETLVSGTTSGIPGLHADLGLITVAPKSSAAGLLIYSRGRWKLVEAEMEADDVVVFGGYTLGWITRGAYRPLLHGVRTMALRRSLIFFLRAHASAPLSRCCFSSSSPGRPAAARLRTTEEQEKERMAVAAEAEDHCVGMRLSEEQQRGLCVESVWSTAGQLQRDFNALRVERRIPVVLLRPMYRLMYYHAPWLHHSEEEADPNAH